MQAASIALISANAMLALFAATILRKRWMKILALGCACFEVAVVAVIVLIARTP